MNDDLADLSDYDLADILTNPLGTASLPMPNRVYAEADTVPEAEATQEQARQEMKRRGYTDGDLRIIEKRDYSPIDRRLAP